MTHAGHPGMGDDEHDRWMDEAIGLARGMLGRAWPNPSVGCVIVRNGEVVGRGQTQPGGRPHAERVALDDAGALARGAALYVTLEPCCHWGKTPPCADAIIAAGIRSVRAALQDPDPRVNGGGFAKLREAGIAVEVGRREAAARAILEGFFTRVAVGRPLITAADRAPASGAVPDFYDAALTVRQDGLVAVTRSADGGTSRLHLPGHLSPLEVAEELGKLGLTTVLLHLPEAGAGTPCARAWQASGAIDRAISPV